MNPGDEEAVKIVPTERPSSGAAAGSIDQLDEQLRVSVEALLNLSPPPKPELDDLLSAITHHLDDEASERKAIQYRLLAIENELKKRGSRRPRGFRYLVAILIGIATALAWQSYGESAKQIIATRAPDLGWSPEVKQMIATSIQWIGWTSAGPEKQAPPVVQTASTTPSLDPGPVEQMTHNLAALRQIVELLAGGQDQMARQIARLEAAVAELTAKIPEPPAQPSVAPARKPTPVPPSSRTRTRQ